MKKVSVIIPAFNASLHFHNSLQSLLHQTMSSDDFEIILINDGSTDNGLTLEIMSSYEQQYPDLITIINLPENVKQGAARNIGMQHITGEYTLFVDADDFVASHALETAYSFAKKYNSDLIRFSYLETNHLTTIKQHILTNVSKDFSVSEITAISSVAERRQFIMKDFDQACWQYFYRTSMLQKYNIRFAEGVYYEETPFIYGVMAYTHKFISIDAVLYYYFHNPDSTTAHAKYIDRIADTQASYESMLAYYRKQNLYETYQQELDYIFWTGYFLLPLLNKAKQPDTFYSKKEFSKLQQHLQLQIPNICQNPYFKLHFSETPILGILGFCDSSNLDMMELQDALSTVEL